MKNFVIALAAITLAAGLATGASAQKLDANGRCHAANGEFAKAEVCGGVAKADKKEAKTTAKADAKVAKVDAAATKSKADAKADAKKAKADAKAAAAKTKADAKADAKPAKTPAAKCRDPKTKKFEKCTVAGSEPVPAK
jgi:hypothetical protein